jgi:hypothetical protein
MKLAIRFVISVRPSVSPHIYTRLSLEGFSLNYVLRNFIKSVQKVLVCLKWDKVSVSLFSFLIIRKMGTVSERDGGENDNVHYLSNTLFPEISLFAR